MLTDNQLSFIMLQFELEADGKKYLSAGGLVRMRRTRDQISSLLNIIILLKLGQNTILV